MPVLHSCRHKMVLLLSILPEMTEEIGDVAHHRDLTVVVTDGDTACSLGSSHGDDGIIHGKVAGYLRCIALSTYVEI